MTPTKIYTQNQRHLVTFLLMFIIAENEDLSNSQIYELV